MAREKRWRIYVCPECGKRHGGAYFCRCANPASRASAVQVVAAEAPNVLTVEEAREIVPLIVKANTGIAKTLTWPTDRIAERLSTYVEENSDG